MNFHNELRDGVVELAGKSFTPLHVHKDPLIHPGRAFLEIESHTMGSFNNNPPVANDILEQKVDMLICNLCQIRTDSIHDMRVLNTDSLSHWNKSPEKFLQTEEK